MPRCLSLFSLALFACSAAAQSVPGLKVPPGFVVTEFAGDDLAHDISAMTIDPQGRIVVAGRGYIKLLIDDNGDGKADRAIDVADSPKGYAMGLLWEGDTLYAVGDQGLNRLKVSPDGKAAGPSELVYKLKATGEHDAHAIKRGGDGWLYWMCGNMAGVGEKEASLPTSPIKKPVAGALLRLSPDFAGCEIIADGFRNAYDFDFGDDGMPYTYDSDNERCVGLPWAEGTRFYRVGTHGHHGWLNPQVTETWRLPPYCPGAVRPLADLGRGSPTGVACYRHVQFPARYRGGFFLGDWTFGRVWFVRPDGESEAFLEAGGDAGFALAALAIHPTTGDLFAAVGGRGTRGGVYRVSYPEGRAGAAGYRTPALPSRPPGRAELRFVPPPGGYGGEEWKEPVAEFRKFATPIRLARVWYAQQVVGGLGSKSARGTAFEGYSRRVDRAYPLAVRDFLRAVFPDGDRAVDRELSRALASIEDDDPTAFGRVVGRFAADSDPVDDIHYLIVAARLKTRRAEGDTKVIASALVGLDRKFAERKLARDRNWPLRIAEVHAELARKDPALNTAILAHPSFARPGNVLLTRCPGFDAKAAAEKFLAASPAKDFAWNGEIVTLLGHLPPERYLPLVEPLWERGGLENELLALLAKNPRAEDRGKFLEGLRSRQLEQTRLCLSALEKLPASRGPDDLVPLVRALRALPDGKAEAPVRDRLAAYLRTVTGQPFGTDRAMWTDWLTKTHPVQAAKLGGADGVDTAAWAKRLAAVDWARGDAGRGKDVFAKASCAACHSGGSALGPDLRGVATRFGRDDLMTAILQPNKDVSPRYRTTQIVTKDGKAYQGLIVYEATDGAILQTGPAATVRIEGDRIEAHGPTDVSLMPAGLLDKLSDGEIADLLAYLKGLK